MGVAIDSLADMEKAGMKVNSLSEAELAKFRKIAHNLYPEAVKDFGKDGKELTDMFVKANK
jgi:TRAP-type C4-dicarboxylate transport system substrate-binding protein